MTRWVLVYNMLKRSSRKSRRRVRQTPLLVYYYHWDISFAIKAWQRSGYQLRYIDRRKAVANLYTYGQHYTIFARLMTVIVLNFQQRHAYVNDPHMQMKIIYTFKAPRVLRAMNYYPGRRDQRATLMNAINHLFFNAGVFLFFSHPVTEMFVEK